ncbi:aminopeptidase [Bengtsoniella intestinalis]|uniref:aminopeptidase n=1 Tax=Bengtsoniella intestinalis TaxID=3073143 RepID=UPI00391F10A7
MDKQAYKDLETQLLSVKKNGYDRFDHSQLPAMEDYCTDYKAFLDAGKTERACVKEFIRQAEGQGYVPFVRGMALEAGSKVYWNNRDKGLMLAYMGNLPLDAGAQISASHIDAPRLDLKPNPLFEDSELAYLKTHYYGGIRKYQWVTIPLELRGVVSLKDGTNVEVNIGADAGDPNFVITDLLPHLGQEQGRKPLNEAISGESLNLLVGSKPIGEAGGSGRAKLAVMKLLNEKYGIVEDDFTSAELEAVPAGNACDIGLDRSMIGAYGHDDRVCSYAAVKAMFDLTEIPQKTAICVLADKEEIGSDGVTGMKSWVFDDFMEALCDIQQVNVRECYGNSFCVSADVTAAFDPQFAEVFEKRNAAFVNYGVGINKYTGARGKSGASDATAEAMAYIRRVFDDANVIWQVNELGKIDVGGGGTVAAYMANRNIDTVDAGVPVLGMHAPFETVSKLDCYQTYLGMKAIFEDK